MLSLLKESVNPYLIKGKHLLTEKELQSKKDQNSLLMEVASPFLKMMDPAIIDSGLIVLLVDSDGYVLSLNCLMSQGVLFVRDCKSLECKYY
jgi:sigma-54 dependent transcriptional regulator, acetoin dehydrogenase operon transcriptional activator AcoR